MSEQTWDDGRLTEDDVIESANGTGYTSVSEFVEGENGFEPDDVDTDHDTDVNTDLDTDVSDDF